MLSKIINVAIVVACMMAASGCLKKAVRSFRHEGKIAINVYDIINDGRKRQLSNLTEEERAKAYKTEGIVFIGFAVTLAILAVGFIIQMFGGNGQSCFFAAMAFEVIVMIFIAIIGRQK